MNRKTLLIQLLGIAMISTILVGAGLTVFSASPADAQYETATPTQDPNVNVVPSPVDTLPPPPAATSTPVPSPPPCPNGANCVVTPEPITPAPTNVPPQASATSVPPTSVPPTNVPPTATPGPSHSGTCDQEYANAPWDIVLIWELQFDYTVDFEINDGVVSLGYDDITASSMRTNHSDFRVFNPRFIKDISLKPDGSASVQIEGHGDVDIYATVPWPLPGSSGWEQLGDRVCCHALTIKPDGTVDTRGGSCEPDGVLNEAPPTGTFTLELWENGSSLGLTDEQAIGNSEGFKVRLLNPDNQPVVGYTVKLILKGAHPEVMEGTTNMYGTAWFAYTAWTPGVDTVRAQINAVEGLVLESNEVTVTWIE